MTAVTLEVWVEVYHKFNERRVVLVTEFGEYTVGSYSHLFFLQTGLDNALSDAKKLAMTLGLPFVMLCELQTPNGACYKVPVKNGVIASQKINPGP